MKDDYVSHTSPSNHLFYRKHEYPFSVPANKTLWQWVYTAKNAAGEVQTLYTAWLEQTDGEKPNTTYL